MARFLIVGYIQSNSLIVWINCHHGIFEFDEYKHNIDKDELMVTPGGRNLRDNSNNYANIKDMN